MSARPLVADGLWRVLCPSYSPQLLRKSIRHSHNSFQTTSARCHSSVPNGVAQEPDSNTQIDNKRVWGKLRKKTTPNSTGPSPREHSETLYVPGLGAWTQQQGTEPANQVLHDDSQKIPRFEIEEEPYNAAPIRKKAWGQLRSRSDHTRIQTADVPEGPADMSKSGSDERQHDSYTQEGATEPQSFNRQDSQNPLHQDRFQRAQKKVESLLSGTGADDLRIPKHLRPKIQATMIARLNRDRVAHKKLEMEAELGRYVTWDEARAAISQQVGHSQNIPREPADPTGIDHKSASDVLQRQDDSSRKGKSSLIRPARLRGTSPWLSAYAPELTARQHEPNTQEAVNQTKSSPKERLNARNEQEQRVEEHTFPKSQNGTPGLSIQEEDFVRAASKTELYERLSKVAAQGQTELVECIVYKLVHDLHEKPNLTLYAALILTNISHTSGSAARARALIEELKADGLTPDAPIYNALLKVLAVHPDAIYRSQILDEMRDQWIDLTPSAQHYIVAGHIKELKLEQGLELLDEMLAKSVDVEPWLLDMVIFQLCALGDINEAFRLLRQRVNAGTASRNAISPIVWLTLFDCAASSLHHPALAYIWRRRVELLKFTPSTGQCTAVLHCAARHADIPLATDVFRALSTRGTTFGREHYELLVDCYTRANDIDTALHVLCIMQTAGVAPNERSTRPLSRALLATPSGIHHAFETLKDLRDQGRVIPLAAVNCIIEATLDAAEAQADAHDDDAADAIQPPLGLAAAIEQYKHVHHLCPSGPNVATFDALLRGCRIARRKDTAMFLAAEMVALGLRPGALTYDRLILVCLQSAEGPAAPVAQDEFGLGVEVQDVETGMGSGLVDAKRYYGEMRSLGLWPRRGTLRQLVERCARDRDAMAWRLVDEMKAGGYDERPTREWLNENWTG